MYQKGQCILLLKFPQVSGEVHRAVCDVGMGLSMCRGWGAMCVYAHVCLYLCSMYVSMHACVIGIILYMCART